MGAVWARQALLVAAAAFLCAGCTTGCATNRAIDRFYEGYEPGAPLNAAIVEEEDRETYRRVRFDFDGLPDQTVPSVMALPPEEGVYPAVIFLHGIGQRKEFLDEIAEPFVEAGFALVTFDQHDRGERRLDRRGPIRSALALRRRTAWTVIETRRLVDYLETRDDIADGRVYLLGASYGAITGATAAAFEERIPAVVLTYGGGHLPTLFRTPEAREELGLLVYPMRLVAGLFFAPADPVHHIGAISPRPVLMQNGKHDTMIIPESAQRLYEAAKEPKEIIWYDSEHIGLDEEQVEDVIDDAIAWLAERDAEHREEAPSGGGEARL